MIDDFRNSTGTALRQASLAAIAAVALFITTAFLCAAAFIAVLHRYGAVEACFAGAAIFFVVTLLAAGSYLLRKRQIEARAAARAKAASSMLADPALLVTGIQIVRALGVRRLLPILAIGGLAFGLMASRSQAPGPAPPAPAE